MFDWPVETVHLPSLSPQDILNATCEKDAQAVREKLLLLFDNGSDAVVVPHSYGGIPAGRRAHGLSKSQREKEGKLHGVVGLVYMSAFVVPKGSSLVEFLGGKHPPYVKENQVRNLLAFLKTPEIACPTFAHRSIAIWRCLPNRARQGDSLR